MKIKFRKFILLLTITALLISTFSVGLTAFAATTLPSSYSSVEKGYVTVPKNQASYSCCWAFSVISCLESDAIIQGYGTKDTIDFSEAHLVNNTYLHSSDTDTTDYFQNMTGTSAFNTGATMVYPLFAAANFGLEDENNFPFYTVSNYQSKMSGYTDEEFYSNNGYYLSSYQYLTTTSAVKQWVIDHGSVSIGVNSPTDKHYVLYDLTIYNSTTISPNHALTIVGWDDDYSKDNFAETPSSNGAWLCKNSWGSSASKSGYAWVSYEDCSIKEYIGMTISKSNNIYTYNGVDSGASNRSATYWDEANIFTATDNQKLDAVSFTERKAGLKPTVSVYKLNNNYTSPVDGNCIFSNSSYTTVNGINTVSPSDSITLETGSSYSIVIHQQSSSSFLIPYENMATTSLCHYYSSSGQSFYRESSSSSWTDISASQGNLYILMYTSDIPAETEEAHNYKTSYTWSSDYSQCTATAVCQNCSDTINEHGTVTSSILSDSTCTTTGLKRYTATFTVPEFTTQTKTVTVSAKGHTAVIDPAVSASCTSSGLTQGSHCSVCGAVIIKQEEIPATGHTVVTDKGTPATCISTGLTDGTHCSVCNAVLTDQEIIPATGHSFTNYISNNDASCDSDGTKTAKCDYCDATDTVTDVGSATGHKTVIDKGTPATCTESGLTDGSHCSECGLVITKQEVIPATGHSFTSYVSDNNATCTQDGTKTAKCDNCNETKTITDYGSATGHSTVIDPAVPATCTESGLTEGSHCSVCGAVIKEQEVIPATGHTIVTDAAVPASCITTGLTEGSHCSACGKVIIKQETTAKTAHTFTTYTSNHDATCVSDGTKTARCDVCGASKTVTDTGSAKGHTIITDAAVAPTCTATGLTEGSHCSVCGCILTVQTEIPATGHSFTSYVYNNDATTEKDGTKTAKCDYCSITDTKTAEGTKIESKTEEPEISFTVDKNAVVKGDLIKLTVVTSTSVNYIKFVAKYTDSSGVTKTIAIIYSATSSSSNLNVTDNGNTRTWVVNRTAYYYGSDGVVTQNYVLGYRFYGSKTWQTYSTPVSVRIGASESALNPGVATYDAYSVVSVSGPSQVVKNTYGTIKIITTDDCKCVRVGYDKGGSMKYAVYQTTSKNASRVDNGDGTATWTLNYKYSYQGTTDYLISARGSSWCNPKTITTTVA